MDKRKGEVLEAEPSPFFPVYVRICHMFQITGYLLKTYGVGPALVHLLGSFSFLICAPFLLFFAGANQEFAVNVWVMIIVAAIIMKYGLLRQGYGYNPARPFTVILRDTKQPDRKYTLLLKQKSIGVGVVDPRVFYLRESPL